MSTEIVRSQTPEEEELARKLAELGLLEGELAERELELATLLSELHVFERRYLHAVGGLYAELDDLRAQIAESRAQRTDEPAAHQEAAEARREAQESAQAAGASGREEPEERFEPSESLRKLYREIAKQVHPDLATKDVERARRTRVMVEVNRAYEQRDEARLRAILREWETSPESVGGEGAGAELVRTIRKIAQVRLRLTAIESEMDQLKASDLYVLMAKADEAETQGRDLLASMAAALDFEIVEARDERDRLGRASDD